MKNEPLVIEQLYDAPIKKVWTSITDCNEMKGWYFELSAFKPEPGFEFHFQGGPPGKIYVHRCKIIEVAAGRKLSYSWQYDGYEGYSIVSFELFPEGDKTRLKLTHEGLESFPANNPDFATKSFMEGWMMISGKLLKEFVE